MARPRDEFDLIYSTETNKCIDTYYEKFKEGFRDAYESNQAKQKKAHNIFLRVLESYRNYCGMKCNCGKSWLERLGVITNKTLYKLIRKVMATVEELKSDLESIKDVVANVSGDVDSLLAQVAALKEQVEQGGAASQADIDALAATAKSIKESLSAVDAKEPAPAA